MRAARNWVIENDAYNKPSNRLVSNDPAETIERCRGIIDWLAHIEEPFNSEQLDAAKADVLHSVVDALEHVEKQIRGCWRTDTSTEAPQAENPSN